LFRPHASTRHASPHAARSPRAVFGGGRSKDRDDIRNIIAVTGSELDWAHIGQWCARHGTQTLLVEIRDARPPG